MSSSDLQNHEQPPQTYQNSDFQVIFLFQKLVKSFQKKIPWENIRLGDQFFFKNVFENAQKILDVL